MTTTRKKRTAIQTKSKSHNCMSEHEFYLHRFFLHVRPTNEWKKERVEYLFILISLLQRLCSCDDISFMLCEENVGSFFLLLSLEMTKRLSNILNAFIYGRRNKIVMDDMCISYKPETYAIVLNTIVIQWQYHFWKLKEQENEHRMMCHSHWISMWSFWGSAQFQ